jgi:hypothetical protein
MEWLSDVKLSSGACRANFAIACCRVEMVSDPGMSDIVPLRRSVIRRPLPSTGSFGSVPRLHQYYGALRLPAAHPAALRCLRLAVPLYVLGCSLPSTAECNRRRPGAFVTRLPLRSGIVRRRQGLPGSWGTLLYTWQPGFTPRPRKTRFRLLARICRAGLVTRWVPRRVSELLYTSSSLPRLLLAHCLLE